MKETQRPYEGRLRRLREVLLGRLSHGVLENVVVDLVVENAALKTSTRLNRLIAIYVILKREGKDISRELWYRNLLRTLKLALLEEDPKQAPLMTLEETRKLAFTKDPKLGIPLAIMIPTGLRFQDVKRLVTSQLLLVKNVATLRIRQTKNIRERGKQRWLSFCVPPGLLGHLSRAALNQSPDTPLVSVSYNTFSRQLKAITGNPKITTYSLRRTALDRIAMACKTGAEVCTVSLHFNESNMRRYLTRQLPDEKDLQLRATSWVATI